MSSYNAAPDAPVKLDLELPPHPTESQLTDFLVQWEIETNRFLDKARGVIHIGANTGQERDLYVNRGLPVVWVEPLPPAFDKLQSYISHVDNQVAFQCLLTDKDGDEYDFGVANNDGQSSSIFDFAGHKEIWPTVGYTESIKIRSTTLKAMVEAKRIDARKYDSLILDVQGAELLVLKGADDLLDGFQWIRCEAADFEIYKGCCKLADLDEYLIPRGFKRVKTWRALGKPDLGYAYEALYFNDRLGASYDDSRPSAKHQLFANGRWQDADGEVQVANDEELEAAKAGKLPVRALTSETRRVNIALAMSTPRIGYLDCLEQIIDLAYQSGLSRFRGQGVFWSHSLSRSIQQAMDWRDEKTGAQFDFILTADYDTFATPANLQALAVHLGAHPEVDAIVPLQAKRGQFLEVLAGWEGARDLTLQLIPIDQGHFGFTMFRRGFFDRLAKPWFREQADADGNWGEGRTDADIGFWANAKASGLSVMLAPRIVVGHGDECVVWPRIVDGKVEKVYQHVNEWNGSKVAPEGIGVMR